MYPQQTLSSGSNAWQLSAIRLKAMQHYLNSDVNVGHHDIQEAYTSQRVSYFIVQHAVSFIISEHITI